MPAQPSQLGAWSAPQDWVYPAIHASLLPNGRVLYWPGYAGDTPRFWDPATAVLTDAPHAGYNIFCAGHAFDSRGRLVVSGGQLILLYGLKDNALFDSVTGAWTRSPQMNYARWYPTCITLPNGDVLSISGLDEQSQTVPIPETFRLGSQTWQTLPKPRCCSRGIPAPSSRPTAKCSSPPPFPATSTLITTVVGAPSPTALFPGATTTAPPSCTNPAKLCSWAALTPR